MRAEAVGAQTQTGRGGRVQIVDCQLSIVAPHAQDADLTRPQMQLCWR